MNTKKEEFSSKKNALNYTHVDTYKKILKNQSLPDIIN